MSGDHLIKNRDRLLCELASELKRIEREEEERRNACSTIRPTIPLCCLEAVLYEGEDEAWTGSVPACLDNLANDLWWDEDREWKDADRLAVRIT